MSNLREYENVYVLNGDMDLNKAKEILYSIKDKISSSGGKNIQVTFLGEKKLSWIKNKVKNGIYFKHNFVYFSDKMFDLNIFLKYKTEILLRHNILLKDNVKLELIKELDDVFEIISENKK